MITQGSKSLDRLIHPWFIGFLLVVEWDELSNHKVYVTVYVRPHPRTTLPQKGSVPLFQVPMAVGALFLSRLSLKSLITNMVAT